LSSGEGAIVAHGSDLGPSAVLTISLCNEVCQFTLIVGTDWLDEFRHGEHTRGFHDGPLPMPPLGLNRIEPGTPARSPADNEATAPLLFGLAIVGFDPLLRRLAAVPRGVIPHEQEGSFALGRKGHRKPREKGAGDHADGTSQHKAPRHPVGCRHLEPTTGNGFALWVLSWSRVGHQAAGRVVAPGVHLGLGFTAPPRSIFEAQRDVRVVGSQLYQSVPAVFFSRMPGWD
jgi:hypothetical protein